MKKFSLVVVALLLISIFAVNVSAADSGTKVSSILDEATEYNGNYYLLIKGEYTWDQAKTYCEGLGGHLATITSQGEDDVCYQLWKNSATNACWLGATDSSLEGIWKWITNEPWNYSNWGGSEPNGGTGENVLNYYGDYSDGRWNDCAADDEFPFICEWESEDIDHIRKTYGYVSSSGMIYNNAFYFNGNVYKVFQYDMSYEDAKAYCEQLGGHLATITSKDEDKAVFTYISKIGNYDCVLGGSDAQTEGLWTWITGESFSYANWNDGEPNDQNGEDFLQYSNTGKWNDIKWKSCFLCEWDSCCILSDGTITEHTLGDPQIITPATCTTIGELKRVCSGCGVEIKEEISMEPHNFLDWETVIEVTCHNDGKQKRECNTCGFAEEQTLTTLTHEWGEWITSTPATCHASGLNERSCKLCGDKEQQTLEQLTHDYGEYIVVSGNKIIPPIVREKTCSLCNDVQTHKDWSNVWITILIGVALIGVIIGIINYIRAFKKR